MKRKRKIFTKKQKKLIYNLTNRALAIFLLIAVLDLCFPQYCVAEESLNGNGAITTNVTNRETSQIPTIFDQIVFWGNNPKHLPIIEGERSPWQIKKMWVTAYSSSPEQTDGNPCRTASGLEICQRGREDIIATNYLNLPFGTKIRIPELFGNQVFTVQDRMNVRFQQTFDVWLKDLNHAKKFGSQWTTIEIY